MAQHELAQAAEWERRQPLLPVRNLRRARLTARFATDIPRDTHGAYGPVDVDSLVRDDQRDALLVGESPHASEFLIDTIILATPSSPRALLCERGRARLTLRRRFAAAACHALLGGRRRRRRR